MDPYRIAPVDEALAKTERDVEQFRSMHLRWRRRAMIVGATTMLAPIVALLILHFGLNPRARHMLVHGFLHGGYTERDPSEESR